MPGLFERYILRRMMLYSGLILLLMVTVLQMLDMMAHSQKIMSVPGAGFYNLGRYALLHAPVFIERFTPFAVLLAVLLALVQLGGASEIIAMRAAGLSPGRILRPLLLGGAFVAMAQFAFQESVAAGAASTLQAWEANNYTARPVQQSARRNIWRSAPGLIAQGEHVSGAGKAVKIDGFNVYQIGPDGLLVGVLQAKKARPGEPSWTLHHVRRLTLGADGWGRDETIGWTAPLQASDFVSRAGPESLRELEKQVRLQHQAHTMTALLTHISRPLSNMLMPLLVFFAGFALPRSNRSALHLLTGIGAGFSFFALDSLMVALGNGGLMAPALATFGALFLFSCAGIYNLAGLEIRSVKTRPPAPAPAPAPL